MTDTELFRQTVKKVGVKYKAVAKSIGITPYGLQRKIENDSQFKAEEISIISDFLRLTPKQRDAIFFASLVE